MNEADEQALRELRFKVGDALPADDPLARFILVVSMGLNDNSLSNTRFVNTKEPYELLYFFRLASGLPLMQALTDAADTEGTISLGEEGLGGIRAHFADELVAKLVMERLGLDDDGRKALVKQLGELQAAYGRFAQAALGRYLHSLGEDVVTEVHGE